MSIIEVQLREGMTRHGITGAAAEQIITSITSFALYGFPESHAASFALLAYASAYLKVHYPAAFYCALLNNQPMGFYHPSTLVKDAQRRGVRFQPIDVQRSAWDCTVEADGGVRLGLRYVNGLRREIGERISARFAPARSRADICPKCGSDDGSLIEQVTARQRFCSLCSHDWTVSVPRRFATIDDLTASSGLRRDELVTLADIGALNTLGYDRRSALWQAERAVRPSGDLFHDHSASEEDMEESCPLKPMTETERLTADYAGTSLTIGRHPMALRREDLATQGILRAADLPAARSGRRVRVAGMVITRQRPGTAKGFVFLTLEDETGVTNVIIRPDLFARDRRVIVEEPFLIVDGVLQSQDGVTSVRAEGVRRLRAAEIDFNAHDFY
jgi:error-prone DNA polymerase